jgi:hypothetical protein
MPRRPVPVATPLAETRENGADVGQRGVNDWTPLHYAIVERDLEEDRSARGRSQSDVVGVPYALPPSKLSVPDRRQLSKPPRCLRFPLPATDGLQPLRTAERAPS